MRSTGPENRPTIESPVRCAAQRSHCRPESSRMNFELGIITRMIRITDLDLVGIEFLERLFLGLLAHPIEFLDPRVISILQVSDERLDLRLRLGRKIFRGVKLADPETHRAESSKAIAGAEVAAAHRVTARFQRTRCSS